MMPYFFRIGQRPGGHQLHCADQALARLVIAGQALLPADVGAVGGWLHGGLLCLIVISVCGAEA